ncbi:hypothetical protein cypCar_00048956 [Cyprinus carpio]|nr:hypothetical protein cypCar_00048956 [Cyprinus carpio]
MQIFTGVRDRNDSSLALAYSKSEANEKPLCSLLSADYFHFSSPQVKVWFQNRRTKFKRQKLEEEGSDSQQKKKGTHHINRWRMATKQGSPEEIDVTSDD